MKQARTLPAEETLDRRALEAHQARRLESLLESVYGNNPFYTRKLRDAGVSVEDLRFPEDLCKLPFTVKNELVEDQATNPPFGTKYTEPLENYTRYCQTSSTTGSPLRWLDTNESWQWVLECWKAVFRGARVVPGDRIFFPFSFGPFLGFWSAFEAGTQIGAHCIPGGGMSSQVRLELIRSVGATVVCCTPTYALWLAEIAARDEATAGSLADCGVRVLIVAGEPGGSIPATRERIERAWSARVIDHHGLTETGPLSFECWESPGFLHLNEAEFICEVLDPASGAPVPDGKRGELVVTNLGRTASPVIRYRTRDIVVRRSELCGCGRTWARLEGGILARADDMVNIRGVNVYPTSIESVVRGIPEIVEFRSTVSQPGAMRSLSVEIEIIGNGDADAVSAKLVRQLRSALGLTVPVRIVENGTLPRFEMKARRFVVEGGNEL
ncbi:MAG TPA: AMP-binding protein [Terriglobia bacterium]|nr:AMP-binding protein [Terriglobia bacterium]